MQLLFECVNDDDYYYPLLTEGEVGSLSLDSTTRLFSIVNKGQTIQFDRNILTLDGLQMTNVFGTGEVPMLRIEGFVKVQQTNGKFSNNAKFLLKTIPTFSNISKNHSGLFASVHGFCQISPNSDTIGFIKISRALRVLISK